MEAIVFIILKIFFAAHTVLKIGEYSRIFPSWGTFGHVMRLDQSRMSKNIDGLKSRIFPSFTWRTFSHVTCLDQSHASKNNRWILRSNISKVIRSLPWKNTRYCQTNSTIVDPCKCCSFFPQKIYVATFVFEFCNSVLTKQNSCLDKSWNASFKWKQYYWKYKRHLEGLNLASLESAFLAQKWDISIKLRWFIASITTLYWPLLWTKCILFSLTLGGVTPIHLIIMFKN